MIRKGRKYERLIYSFGYSSIDPDIWAGREEEAKLRARVEFFASKGRGEVEGIHLTARWRNPDNRHERHRQWKTTDDPGQSLPDFYSTLHGARGALAMAEEQTRDEWMRFIAPKAPPKLPPPKPKRKPKPKPKSPPLRWAPPTPKPKPGPKPKPKRRLPWSAAPAPRKAKKRASTVKVSRAGPKPARTGKKIPRLPPKRRR